MKIDEQAVERALHEALDKYPMFSQYGPRLVYHELADGGAFMLSYENRPPAGAEGVWEFQNLVVKRYQSLAGGSPGC
jgi:hypothetical protein